VVLTNHPVFAAIVTDPQLISEVLVNQNESFQKGPNSLYFRYALGDGTATYQLPKDNVQYYSPLPSLSAYRQRKRQFITPSFSSRHKEKHCALIYQLTSRYMETWQEGGVRDMYKELNSLMLRISIECLFNREVSEPIIVAGQLEHASMQMFDQWIREPSEFTNVTSNQNEQNTKLQHRWQLEYYQSTLQKRDEIIQAAVDYLLSSPPKDVSRDDDLISRLVSARYSETGDSMTKQQLMYSLSGLVFASYENSAVAAAWILWCLATNLDSQQRVIAEIDGMGNDAVRFAANFERLPYLRACIQEGLRVYPSVWSTARETNRDVHLGDYFIPQGGVLILSPWVQHHRPASWPDPDIFRPMRFFSGFAPALGDFFPFGMGQTACIGKGFAWSELSIVIANILRNWHIEPAAGYDVPIPMLRIFQRPEPGVFLHISPKH